MMFDAHELRERHPGGGVRAYGHLLRAQRVLLDAEHHDHADGAKRIVIQFADRFLDEVFPVETLTVETAARACAKEIQCHVSPFRRLVKWTPLEPDSCSSVVCRQCEKSSRL